MSNTTASEAFPARRKLDGYWLRMGHLAIDALVTAGHTKPMTAEEDAVVAEWFGYLLNEAHDVGMRLGEAKGEYTARMKSTG